MNGTAVACLLLVPPLTLPIDLPAPKKQREAGSLREHHDDADDDDRRQHSEREGK
jgi:hypothetical protein